MQCPTYQKYTATIVKAAAAAELKVFLCHSTATHLFMNVVKVTFLNGQLNVLDYDYGTDHVSSSDVGPILFILNLNQ
uniref:Uncharacterized protein n=1 Tax=Glossina brevipalpis TaxID=37001 RepID=A0A1A9WP83_9MUSC